MPLTRGTRVGPYEIGEPLGSGAMGEVYRAWDPKLARHVALKILNLDAAANATAITHFEQEARIASALNHPGIVSIHDTGESGGHFYIVMEIVEGKSLRHMLLRGRPTLKKALHLASQLADALAKAHEVGIVHRDLKPDNVMVSGDGHVKIVDFGLAKLAEPAVGGGPRLPAATTTVSARGLLLGTVGYMSPEQASGEETDFRADQFAFGAILYELATGARAFQRETTAETLALIISGEPERPLALNPSLPLPLVWTIERCLSKDPADRYASTRDLAREVQTLRDHAADLDTLERPFGAIRTRGRAFRVAAIAAAVAVAGGAAAGYLAFQTNVSDAAQMAPVPTFKQLTFRRGHLVSARFAPDGQTILYSAMWDGGPIQVFETRSSGPESRLLEAASVDLASISRRGDVALILGCQLTWGNCIGTLATRPLGGGAAREVLEDVAGADWAPDGGALAVTTVTAGEYRIQFPIGKQLYATTSKLGPPAISPGGDRIAFIEYAMLSEEEGSVKTVDLAGRVTTVSSGWKRITDIRWSPSGDEIWVAAGERTKTLMLYGVSLSGARRLIFQGPGGISLMDVGRDGRALVKQGIVRAQVVSPMDGRTRDLSWLDWSTVADLSADGTTVLFYEWGLAVGGTPIVYTRNVNGAEPMRLGEGKALALSPDKRWALALQEAPPAHLVLLPTGAGASRALPSQSLTDFYWARWFPDGRRLLVVGAGDDAVPRSFIQDIETGIMKPLGDKGMLGALVAPEGRRILMADPLEGYLVWPLDGGKPVAVPGLDPRDRPIQWSADGRFLYVKGPEDWVLRIYRHNLITGQRELWKELAPTDSTGVIGVATGRGELAMTPDGKKYVFTYWTSFTDLFLVEGLARSASP
jgi:Tol biopolymer transport system component